MRHLVKACILTSNTAGFSIRETEYSRVVFMKVSGHKHLHKPALACPHEFHSDLGTKVNHNIHHVAAEFPCTRAFNRFSLLRQLIARALANEDAAKQ